MGFLDDRSPAPAADRPGWFARLRDGLRRTRDSLGGGLATLVRGHPRLDADLLDDLEMRLLGADVGLEATERVIARLKREAPAPDAILPTLRAELAAVLDGVRAQPLDWAAHRPFVVLVVGVNGAGKTTTIGKLAQRYRSEGRAVLLGAGDTFRAAAVDQLAVWGERNGVPVISRPAGTDPAAVLHDALQAAQARGADVLLADTAGRLHNKQHLMDELGKVVRVLRKLDPTAPHEVLLVLDGTTGQNALAQARHFQQAAGVTSLAITKLDGTAKGGVVFALAEALRLPVRYIGVGEGIDDLREFDADEFVAALVGD